MQLAKRILRLALPSIATFSSMTFTGLLVLMIIGKLGAASIAVVGITNILIYNLWALFSGVQGTVNYLVAQNIGQRSIPQGTQRMQIALIVTVAQGVLLLAASFLLPHVILQAMGTNEDILSLGAAYFQIRMIALIFGLFNGVFFAYMRAAGDTKTPMTLAIINGVLVVALTYVLSYGALGFPELGLQGSAWAFIWAELATMLLCMLVYFRFMSGMYLTRKWMKMEREQVRLVLFESLKLGVTEFSNSLGMFVFTVCIMRLGTAAIAANEIALNILSFGFMPSNGFGAAATIGVGQEIGKGKPAEARKFGIVTVYLGLVFMAIVSLCLMLFALPVAKLYTHEAEVYTLAISLIHLAAFIQLFTGANIIFGGGLRGVGDTTFLSRAAFLTNWLFFIPLTVLLTRVFELGQVGAWTALCSVIVLSALLNTWRFLRLDWSKVKVKSGAPVPVAAGGH